MHRVRRGKLKLSGKESVDPTTLVAEQPVAPQRASDAVSFKNPDEILEACEGGTGRENSGTDKRTKDNNRKYMQVTGFGTSTRSGRSRSSCNFDRNCQLASSNDRDKTHASDQW